MKDSNPYDPYQRIKQGIRKDAIAGAINLTGGIGVLLLIVLLIMMLVISFSRESTALDSTRLVCLTIFLVITPCLFFKKSSNFIIRIWGAILLIVIGGTVLFLFFGFAIVLLGLAFGYNILDS